MNRKERRSKMSLRDKLLRNNPEFNRFIEIDLNESSYVPSNCFKAFQNSLYIVTLYKEQTDKSEAIRMMIQRKDNRIPVNQFQDFQRIKNSIFGQEAVAIQYFPKETHLVDDYNIYWLYVFPDGVLPNTSSKEEKKTLNVPFYGVNLNEIFK